MHRDELVKKMRARVDKCRWRAKSVNDAKASETLNAMADEGEADIARLLAEKDGP